MAAAGRSIVYLVLGMLSVGVALGYARKSGQSEDTLSAKLMAVPVGGVLVVAVGVAVIAVGVAQIVKGVKKNFTEDLDSSVSVRGARLGTVGYCAKGVALAIIGGAVRLGGGHLRPGQGRRDGRALTTIRDQPFGTVLLVIMAAGIACFGLYCFVWARKARY